MKIETYSAQTQIIEKDLHNKTVLVIDVFRATTSIIAALYNGAREVIPVAGIEEAITLSKNYDKKSFLLGGERNTLKIEGFDLSNSPSDYSRNVVEGRTLILTTTNGTEAIRKAHEAKDVIIAGFVNVLAVVSYLKKKDEKSNIAFVCAGTDGKFSLEDAMAVGAILFSLKNEISNISIDDLGLVCLYMFQIFKDNLKEALRDTKHFNRLISANLSGDIEDCLEINSFPIIPIYKDGIIRVANS